MEIPYVVNPRKDTGLFNSKIAIWLFLASEVMLFGGLFSGYVFLRIGADYPWPERTLPVLPGLINTFILIASSVTVVFAWAALKMRNWRQFQVFMGATVLFALIFMGFKAIEYGVKFKHQALRMKDFTMVEGHISYVKDETPAGDSEDGYLRGVDGRKVEANKHVFGTTGVSFDLARFHKPWVGEMIGEAERQGIELKLAKDYDFNPPDASERKHGLVFKEGSPLTLDLLGRMQDAFTDNRAYNAKWRARFLREAWALKHQDVADNDLLGETSFGSEYPKGLELPPGERREAFVRWRAGKRSLMSQDVAIEQVKLSSGQAMPVLIDGKTYAQLERPLSTVAEFTTSGELVLRYRSLDVITDYKEGNTTIALRDATKLTGAYRPSPLDFHEVDGIDFQHLVMDAEAKNLDPEITIENSWLVKNNKDVADLWEMHKQSVAQLEEILARKYGFKKGEDGGPLLDLAGNPVPKRVPTHKDRYRMGWQEIAYYMELLVPHREAGKPGVPEVVLDKNANAPPKVTMTAKEHFMGPDYEVRKFPQMVIPRAQALMDSKFTPKWNNYYAIYFTITGLHGLHVVGGAIVLAYYLFFGRAMYLTNPEWLANRVEVGGLFWHFVDLVWIFAFPIFYLM